MSLSLFYLVKGKLTRSKSLINSIQGEYYDYKSTKCNV